MPPWKSARRAPYYRHHPCAAKRAHQHNPCAAKKGQSQALALGAAPQALAAVERGGGGDVKSGVRVPQVDLLQEGAAAEESASVDERRRVQSFPIPSFPSFRSDPSRPSLALSSLESDGSEGSLLLDGR